MVFNFDRGTKLVIIKMPKYATKIVESYPTPEKVRIKTPRNTNLLRVQDSSKLTKKNFTAQLR